MNLRCLLSQKQNANQFSEINKLFPALQATHLIISVSYVVFYLITVKEGVPGAMACFMNDFVQILSNFLENELG